MAGHQGDSGKERSAGEPLFPKGRLDSLTDGVFAFAMTLLVINLEVPDGFDPSSNADLLAAFRELDSALIAYVVTFLTLALRWIGQVRMRGEPEMVHGHYLWPTLALLFFITVMPFSTQMIGRYDDLPAAIWLYAANMIASALAGLWLSAVIDRELGRRQEDSGRIELLVLIGSALVSVALSFFAPAQAMWAYVLNFLGPPIRGIVARRMGDTRGW